MLIQILRDCGDMKSLKILIVLGVELDFLVTFDNCSLLWVPKIHTDIALYILLSEYVALYHYVRAVLPLKSLIKEVIFNLAIDSEKLKLVSNYTVHEDTNIAIVVEKVQENSYIQGVFVKYHWFRQQVGNEFVIWKIKSENQKAGIFTKG